MLPDFPSFNEELSKYLTDFFQQRFRLHLGPLQEIRRYRVFEGPSEGMSQQLIRHSGEAESSGFELTTTEIAINTDEFIKMSLDQVLSKLDEAAKDMAGQVARNCYQRISETLERTGNTIDAQGRKMSAEVILEMLSSIHIDFDHNELPRMPTFHIHPDMTEALKLALTELGNNPELKREHDWILAMKKEEWREREASRNLVG